jgi:hypothetical protein
VYTPLTAVCQQTTLKIEEEAIEFINYLWKNDTKFKTFKGLEKTATNYAESNGLRKIMDNLDCIQRKILDVALIYPSNLQYEDYYRFNSHLKKNYKAIFFRLLLIK